jgi:hypothetical protein
MRFYALELINWKILFVKVKKKNRARDREKDTEKINLFVSVLQV